MAISFDPPSNKAFSLPKGKYKVRYDGKFIAEFGSLEEAQKYLSECGIRGAHVVPPNLRKEMSDDNIMSAENILKNWGKK